MRIEIKYIFVDESGVITNDLERVCDATNKVFKHYREPPITIEEFKKEFEIPFRLFYEKYGISDPQEKVQKLFREYFESSSIPVTPFPDAVETLRFLKEEQEKHMAIVSTNPHKYLNQDVENFGIKDCFDVIMSDAFDKGTVMRQLLEKSRVKPREALCIDDMEYAIRDAKSLGINTCAITGGYRNSDVLNACKPTLTFSHLKDIKTYWTDFFV